MRIDFSFWRSFRFNGSSLNPVLLRNFPLEGFGAPPSISARIGSSFAGHVAIVFDLICWRSKP